MPPPCLIKIAASNCPYRPSCFLFFSPCFPSRSFPRASIASLATGDAPCQYLARALSLNALPGFLLRPLEPSVDASAPSTCALSFHGPFTLSVSSGLCSQAHSFLLTSRSRSPPTTSLSPCVCSTDLQVPARCARSRYRQRPAQHGGHRSRPTSPTTTVPMLSRPPSSAAGTATTNTPFRTIPYGP